MPRRKTRLPLRDRLVRFIKVDSETGCWLWTGHTSKNNKSGYIRMPSGTKDGVTMSVNRVVYTEYVGPIPEGACVCHKCRTIGCVNPEHLFLGTVADAIWGRNHARGMRHGKRKLTWADVIRIRSLRVMGYYCREIAREYGVRKSLVERICDGKLWKDTEDRNAY